jgi:hypothetical protein
MQRNLERELWLRVIRFAQEEAAGRHTSGMQQRTTMLRARRWMTTRTASFVFVCKAAGLNDAQIDMLVEMACETSQTIPLPEKKEQ